MLARAGADGRARIAVFAVAATAALLLMARSSSGVEAGRSEAKSGPPKQVLVVDSFGRDFSPYNVVASTFRTELAARSPFPIEFLEFSVEPESLERDGDGPIVEFAGAVFGKRRPDLVVSVGGPASRLLQRNDQLFPGIPGLLGAAEERHLSGGPLPAGLTAVSTRIDLDAALRGILELMPGTENVFVVLGSTPLERYWHRELEREWKPYGDRVRVTFLDGLSFEELCRHVGTLPPRSAIYFALLLRDATGIPYEKQDALERLQERANAPLFSWASDSLGHGIVGGSLIPVRTLGREMADVADQLLRGKRPADVPPRLVLADRPVFDARELRRWGIGEGRLPVGSEVRFRRPSFFAAYRWQVLGGLFVIGAQSLAITGLLVTRRRRRRVEAEARRLREELAHRERVTALGHLASSLAHELSQPLGAILRNAEAAEVFLAADPPDLAEVRAIVEDILKDDRRAGEVIERMRGLLRRHSEESLLLVTPELVDEVVCLVRPDAQSRRVKLEVAVPRELPRVRGDHVHLQQVLLNLFMNGMEAMESVPEERRVLRIRAGVADAGGVEIAVADSGSGISPDDVQRIFEPFFTTKATGLGMGLAISRTLVEAQGGRMVVESKGGEGTTIRVVLPAAGAAG